MSASVTTFRTTAETELAAQFAAMTPTTNLAQRKEAFRRIAENGLPTRRVEAWHYTDLRAQMKSAAPLAHEPAAAWKNKRPWSLVQGDAVFSFVDGWLMSAPKLPEGVTCTSFAGDSEKFNRSVAAGFDLSEDAIASLNAAFMTGGLLIEVAAGVVVEQPLSLAFETTDATASCARV